MKEGKDPPPPLFPSVLCEQQLDCLLVLLLFYSILFYPILYYLVSTSSVTYTSASWYFVPLLFSFFFLLWQGVWGVSPHARTHAHAYTRMAINILSNGPYPILSGIPFYLPIALCRIVSISQNQYNLARFFTIDQCQSASALFFIRFVFVFILLCLSFHFHSLFSGLQLLFFHIQILYPSLILISFHSYYNYMLSNRNKKL